MAKNDNDEGHLKSKAQHNEINKTGVDNKEKYYRIIASQKIASVL